MNVMRSVTERQIVRFQSPALPKRGAARLPSSRGLFDQHSHKPSEMWWGREVHPELSGPLRGIAELVLWLLAVLTMIWLFAEFWLPR